MVSGVKTIAHAWVSWVGERQLICLLSLAALTGWFVSALEPAWFHDSKSYFDTASILFSRHSGILPRPPLYPLLLKLSQLSGWTPQSLSHVFNSAAFLAGFHYFRRCYPQAERWLLVFFALWMLDAAVLGWETCLLSEAIQPAVLVLFFMASHWLVKGVAFVPARIFAWVTAGLLLFSLKPWLCLATFLFAFLAAMIAIWRGQRLQGCYLAGSGVLLLMTLALDVALIGLPKAQTNQNILEFFDRERTETYVQERFQSPLFMVRLHKAHVDSHGLILGLATCDGRGLVCDHRWAGFSQLVWSPEGSRTREPFRIFRLLYLDDVTGWLELFSISARELLVNVVTETSWSFDYRSIADGVIHEAVPGVPGLQAKLLRLEFFLVIFIAVYGLWMRLPPRWREVMPVLGPFAYPLENIFLLALLQAWHSERLTFWLDSSLILMAVPLLGVLAHRFIPENWRTWRCFYWRTAQPPVDVFLAAMGLAALGLALFLGVAGGYEMERTESPGIQLLSLILPFVLAYFLVLRRPQQICA